MTVQQLRNEIETVHRAWYPEPDAQVWPLCLAKLVEEATEWDEAPAEPQSGDSTHVWLRVSWLNNQEVCKVCATVRRADRKNKPCRGNSVLVLRMENKKKTPANQTGGNQRNQPRTNNLADEGN